jgi:hypothetical protein
LQGANQQIEAIPEELPNEWVLFRPFGAYSFLALNTHGLRHGLHSAAASRLKTTHSRRSECLFARCWMLSAER